MFQLLNGMNGWGISLITLAAVSGVYMINTADHPQTIPGPAVKDVTESVELATRLCHIVGEDLKSYSIFHEDNTTMPRAVYFKCTGFVSGMDVDTIKINVHKKLTPDTLSNRIISVCGIHGLPADRISIKQSYDQELDYYVTCKGGVSLYNGSFKY